MCFSLICRLTCQGHFRSGAGNPPIILIDLWPHPGASVKGGDMKGKPLTAPAAAERDDEAMSPQTAPPNQSSSVPPEGSSENGHLPSELKRRAGATSPHPWEKPSPHKTPSPLPPPLPWETPSPHKTASPPPPPPSPRPGLYLRAGPRSITCSEQRLRSCWLCLGHSRVGARGTWGDRHHLRGCGSLVRPGGRRRPRSPPHAGARALRAAPRGRRGRRRGGRRGRRRGGRRGGRPERKREEQQPEQEAQRAAARGRHGPPAPRLASPRLCAPLAAAG